jgi:succinate dehydrogenase / fumarate reductase cytochrome b subunit
VAATANPVAPQIKSGVAPLRAGQGTSFLLRRLHSLSGVVPIGAFLLEHFISNAEAFKGPIAHGLYGIYIWYQGETNVGDYPWTGNWLYASQRWTGIIALIFMVQHTYFLRFTGVHLPTHPFQAFAKVQAEFEHPWMIAFYAIGIIAASWHFSYGLWLFAAKWGITTGEHARRRFGYLCLALALGLVSIGAASMYGFLSAPPQPLDSDSGSENITMR